MGRNLKTRSALCCMLLLTLTVNSAAQGGDPARDAESGRLFARGKDLIEANCGDCMGASRKGLEQGIEAVEKAIAAGYKDKKEAYALLGEALNTLAAVYDGDSAQAKQTLARVQTIYRQLLAEHPRDPEILYLYAASLDPANEAEQLSAFRKVLEVKPNHVNARYAVGKILVAQGNIEQGLKELKISVRLADAATAEAYGKELKGLLIREGRTAEADEVEGIVKMKVERQERNRRDSNPALGTRPAAVSPAPTRRKRDHLF